MKRDSDQKVIIFTEALRLPTHERAAFLQRRCGAKEPLRQKVEALLKAHDRAGDFLTKTPTGRSLD
jgi:eukaryotic-like serine/threonine-protein kinase